MPDKVFIDTNVFVYLSLDNPHHAAKRNEAISLINSLHDSTISISVQVLNELYNVLLKNLVFSGPEFRHSRRKNVPAYICAACGNKFFSNEVMQ